MKLVTLYECLFEAPVDSEIMKLFLLLCTNKKTERHARLILRQFNLTQREQALFGSSCDPLKEISDTEDEAANPYKNKVVLVYLFAKKLFPKYSNKEVARVIELQFEKSSDKKAVLAIMDKHYSTNHESFFKAITPNLLQAAFKAYPCHIKSWGSLLLNNTDDDVVLHYWIAPLLQHCIQKAPKTLDDVKKAYSLLHTKKWPYESLFLFFIVSAFLLKEDCFFEKISDANFTKMIQSAEKIHCLSDMIADREILKAQFRQRLEHSIKNNTTLQSEQLVAIINNVDKAFATSLIKDANSTTLFSRLMSQSLDSNWGNLITLTNTYLPDPADKLSFFNAIPNDFFELYLYRPLFLSSLITCLPIDSRYDFFITKVSRDCAIRLQIQPYFLCHIANLFAPKDKITWLKQYFSSKSLLSIKRQNTNNNWKHLFSSKLSAESKCELNEYLYPGDDLTVHNALKRIKKLLHDTFNLFPPENAGNKASYNGNPQPMTNRAKSIPMSIINQYAVFSSIKSEGITEKSGLERIKQFGRIEYSNLQDLQNKASYTFFQTPSHRKYINAFANDESFKNTFMKPTSVDNPTALAPK